MPTKDSKMLHIRVSLAYPLASGEVGTLARAFPALCQALGDGDIAAFLKYHPEVLAVLDKLDPRATPVLRAMQGGDK